MQAHEGFLHRRHFGGKKSGEVNQKGQGTPEVIIKNKRYLQINGKGYNKVILDSALDFL